MNAGKLIVAVFALFMVAAMVMNQCLCANPWYTITSAHDANHNWSNDSVTPAAAYVESGQSKSFTIVVDEDANHYISRILVDDVEINMVTDSGWVETDTDEYDSATAGVYTFSNVAANHTLNVGVQAHG